MVHEPPAAQLASWKAPTGKSSLIAAAESSLQVFALCISTCNDNKDPLVQKDHTGLSKGGKKKEKEKAELYSDVYNMFFTSAFEMH